MPDNLIIAPDGLVKVEPSRCIFCGRLAVCEDPARCQVLRPGLRCRRKGGTETPRRKRSDRFDVNTNAAPVIN